jgi:ABC-2 type transport system permease protein
MTAAIAQSAYMTQRHARVLIRQPWFLAITLVQPIIWLLLFGALFRSVTEIPGFGSGGSYLDYLVPGVVVMTALFSSGWSGMGIIEDMDRGLMDRFLVSPVHRSSLIAGRVAYEAIALVLQATIICGLALILGAKFEGGPVGFAVLVLCAVLLAAAFASLSDASALLLRQRESVIGINTLMVLPLTFVSAAFMPLALAPDWIATLARINPVNWAVEAGRAALLAGPDWSFILPRLGGLLIVAIVCLGLATRAFRSYQRSV